MTFDSIIKSNHDLKKNGYKIIDKLHKLEKKNNVKRVVSKQCPQGYFFVLSCENLILIIQQQYKGLIPDKILNKFLNKSYNFVDHLKQCANTESRIDKHILSSYLKTFTKFFNFLIENKIQFNVNQQLLNLWNSKCVMSFIAAWGVK